MAAALTALAVPAPSSGVDGSAGPLVQVSGASPFAACTADAVAGQSGQNYPNAEVEPWLSVNPANPDQLAAVWQQDRWSNGGSRGLVTGSSRDGGRTWTTTPLPGVSICSGGTYERVSDPWVSFGPTGELYALSLALNNRDEGHALLVSKSADGGRTWGSPITILAENIPGVLNDKESITADPTDARYAYAVWDRLVQGSGPFTGPTWFSRTTDGGRTWEPARSILETGPGNQSLGNQITVTPDGTLVNLFSSINNLPTRRVEISVIRSTDKGATWSAPIRVDSQSTVGTFDPETNDPVRAAGFIPDIAVDRRNGALYAVWEEGRFESNTIPSVAFSQSLDGGRTWSPAVRVNRTPSSVTVRNRQAFVPQVDVVADGTVVVNHYDFRNNDAAADLRTDAFAIHCHAACTDASSWGDETRLTDTSFNLRTAPVARGFFVGDYSGLDHAGNDALVLFGQTHGGDPSSIFIRRVASGRSGSPPPVVATPPVNGY
ncbi:MAG: sialidase family protein, partial [Acidimicrobiales bacterium]